MPSVVPYGVLLFLSLSLSLYLSLAKLHPRDLRDIVSRWELAAEALAGDRELKLLRRIKHDIGPWIA
jgi:hypothetical protein